MGDRTSVNIQIGGKLKRSLLEDFADACQHEDLAWDYGDKAATQEEIEDAVKEGGTLELLADQANYGNVDAVTNFLRAQGMFFVLEWDAGDSFGPGGTRRDEIGEIDYAQIEGDPMLSTSTLLDLGDWPRVAAWCARLTAPIPPFEIVEDD